MINNKLCQHIFENVLIVYKKLLTIEVEPKCSIATALPFVFGLMET